ncbi:transcription factor SRM1-like [Bidens hawaiensis]|uniref:transcription factor SRM1-like n=1 Tax=Bidens hawaiensis TaxID=980011 RepID=UPI00404B0F94
MHNDQENNMNVQWPLVDSTWTRHEHSMFVNAVANGTNGLEEIAGMIPSKKPEELKAYYEAVVGELLEIEAGRVELPDYPDGDSYPSKIEKAETVVNEDSGSKPREKERKKANPWTVEEHKRFLDGLKKYGKGDWRSISRMSVITRTATQVASHAQKFFLRQTLPKEGNNSNNKKRKKKRYSIHDITTTGDAVLVHAQPASTTSSPSDLSGEQSNGSQERVAQSLVTLTPSILKVTEQPMSSTPAATSFYDGKGKGVAAITSSSHYFSGEQYYGGQGVGAVLPLITSPSYSFCDGQGGEAPQPFSSYYDGQGGAQPGYEFSFYNGYPGETNL